MIILNILGIILLIILLLFIMILFIPFILTFKVQKQNSSYFYSEMTWFFRIVCISIEKKVNKAILFSIKIFGIRIPIPKSKEKSKESKKRRKKEEKKKKYNYQYLMNKPFLGKIMQLILKILKHISPDELKIDIEYGFDNPADTGMLHGFVVVVLNNFPKHYIKIIPIFDRELFQGELFLKSQVFLGIIAFYALQLILSKTFRNTMKRIKNK